MAYRLGVLQGDDIGLEIVPEAVRIATRAAEIFGASIEWVDVPIGQAAYQAEGATLPDGTLERLEQLDGWILGPIGHRDYPDDPRAVNPHPILRKHFDLFANIRPVKSHPTVASLHQDVDLVLVRENNEGFQPDRNVVAGCGEFRPTHDTTISVRVITREGSSKIARAAFDLARRRRRDLVAVHKDTVFKLGCGMFAEECRRLAAEYPDVHYHEEIVDTFAMRLAMHPQRYDVIVTTNMFGDILSDLAAAVVGGLGLAPGLSAGPRHAMAQAAHGSAPDIAGRGIANPYAMVFSTQQLLGWLADRRDDAALRDAAGGIAAALDAVMDEGGTLTPDLGGSATTREMSDAILQELTAS